MAQLHDPQGLRRLTIIAICASLSVVLGVLEALIPFAVTIPGAKLGLGNIMVLTCLVTLGGRDALWLVLLKTLLTAFILGTFSTFMFSLLGSLCSLLLMFAMLRLGRSSFSLIGVSVAGGVAHNAGQLLAAAMVLGTTKIFYYFPVLVLTGLITGIFVGMAARHLISSLARIDHGGVFQTES
ncbi:Gx transporter family protein [Paenibacillus campinasensis]